MDVTEMHDVEILNFMNCPHSTYCLTPANNGSPLFFYFFIRIYLFRFTR
jgi:hypothetical protein